MKRVACLYRVSTIGQVEKDDIPMQKTCCRDFAAKQDGWKIVKEFYEKGVSGFKKSAKDRDAIVELQEMAIRGEFDVLLVFMFDRLGRKDDETPFVVEWFVRHGIEVWSVHEGEQRFDTHVDKLLNYIRFWNASGESIKTSIRTKSRMEQIVLEGRFKGGVAPYGYRLVHKGRLNKKGRPVYDIEIDDYEASIVRYIFDLYVNHGLGTQSIARRLTEESIRNRKGKNFVSPTIKNILKNPAYRGILRCGDGVSEPFEHLRIIDDETFFKAQEIMAQRTMEYQEKRRIPRKIAKNCLLTGNIFCAHCGARLITSTSGGKRKRKDGSYYIKRTWRYVCYNRMRHKEECDGQTGYSAKRIDEAVSEAVRRLLRMLTKASVEEIAEERYSNELKAQESRIAQVERSIKSKERELATLKGEVVKAINGESSFESELLSGMIKDAQDAIEKGVFELAQINADKASIEMARKNAQSAHNKLVGFDEMFDACDRDQKRMVICQLIDEIRVKRGYEIELKLSFSYEQFMEHADKRILEEEGYTVMLTEKETKEELNDLNFHEAVFELLEQDPKMEWKDAVQELEIPFSGEQADALRSEMSHAFNKAKKERSEICIA